MSVLEIVALDEATPQLKVPQVADTYILPRATTTPAQITSTLATGTAPLVIASTTKVDNLHVARATLGDTVTTNANLTGHITSVGNAAVLGSFTVAQFNTACSDGDLGTGDFKADGTVDMTGQFGTDVGTFKSDVANGATAVGYLFNTSNTYSTAGANLARFSNNSTVILDVSFQGGIDHVNSGASTAAHSQSLNLNWVSAVTRTSSGAYSAVIGQQNTASGQSSMAFGESHSVSGAQGCALNSTNSVVGQWGCAVNYGNTISTLAIGSFACGHTASLINRVEFGIGAGLSGSQTLIETLKVQTTNATQTELLANADNCVIPADTTWCFSALVVGRSNEADGNDSGAYRIEGCIARDESNNTALVGSVTVTTIAESAGATAWDVTAAANDTNETLAIKVTGEAATTINWVASVRIAAVLLA